MIQSKTALLQLNIFKDANGSYFSYLNGLSLLPPPTQSLLCSIHLLAIIIALFSLVPFLEKHWYD